MRRLGLRETLLVVLVAVFLCGPLVATSHAYWEDSYWVCDPSVVGDWHDQSNWSPWIATSSGSFYLGNAIIDNGGTASVTKWAVITYLSASHYEDGGTLKIGDAYSGAVIQSGESSYLCAHTGIFLGYGPGSTGTYTLSGGELGAVRQWVGYQGTGHISQSAGLNSVGVLALGYSERAVGTYVLSGGVISADYFSVGWWGKGQFTQTGGSVDVAEALRLALRPGGTGTYTLEAGTLRAGRLEIGWYTSGRFVQSGGVHCVQNDCYVGYDLTTSGEAGEYELRGGSLSVGGNVYIGSGEEHSHGGPRGAFRVEGGSLVVDGEIFVIARGSVSAAELVVSRSAYVQTKSLRVAQGEGRSARVAVEVAWDGNAVIHTSSESILAGVLDVQSVDGFRPREGDMFTIIECSDPNGPCFSGDFSEFASNITQGLPAGLAFAGAASGSHYDVVFLGLTAGDANGDHAVDGGDLALMGGSWLQSGRTWGTCDFDGDGTVSGRDLALMGGNWLWSLGAPPPAPGVPIPEPSVAIFLGTGAVLTARRRRG